VLKEQGGITELLVRVYRPLTRIRYLLIRDETTLPKISGCIRQFTSVSNRGSSPKHGLGNPVACPALALSWKRAVVLARAVALTLEGTLESAVLILASELTKSLGWSTSLDKSLTQHEQALTSHQTMENPGSDKSPLMIVELWTRIVNTQHAPSSSDLNSCLMRRP